MVYWCNYWCIGTFVTKVFACHIGRCSRVDWRPTADSASAHSGTPRPFCNPPRLCSPVSLLCRTDGMHSRAVEWGVTAAQRIMRLTSKPECPLRMNKRPRRPKSSLFSFVWFLFPSASSHLVSSHPRLTILNNPALASTSSHYRGLHPLVNTTSTASHCDAGAPQHMSLNANPARTGRCFRILKPGSLPAVVAFKFLLSVSPAHLIRP